MAQALGHYALRAPLTMFGHRVKVLKLVMLYTVTHSHFILLLLLIPSQNTHTHTLRGNCLRGDVGGEWELAGPSGPLWHLFWTDFNIDHSLSLSVEEITLSWVECIGAIFVQFVQFDSACRRGESVQ